MAAAASVQIPAPAPMEMKGDLVANWAFFEESWKNYEIATELDKKDMPIRAATLLSVVAKIPSEYFNMLICQKLIGKRQIKS